MLEFLNKTDLTVAENIILAVIITVICSMMIPYIWNLCKLLFKYIYNKINRFIKYLIRLKKGKLTVKELIEIENNLKAGQKYQ